MNTEPKVRAWADAKPSEITRAHKSAALTAKRTAGNFFYAFRLLPRDQKEGIQALYAFCRAGDDAADNRTAGDPGSRIESLRQRLGLIFAGNYCDDLTLALLDAHRRFGFERAHFDELLAGLEMDLTLARYATFAELRQYCYRVASSVGLLCLRIFRCDSDQTRNYAEQLGIAMQLTNILRDLAEDYRRGRIYIPGADLLRFGLDEKTLAQTIGAAEGEAGALNRDRFHELIQFEAARAEGFFASADEALLSEMYKPMLTARIMGAIYRRLLQRIRAARRFDLRIRLSAGEKLAIASRMALESAI